MKLSANGETVFVSGCRLVTFQPWLLLLVLRQDLFVSGCRLEPVATS